MRLIAAAVAALLLAAAPLRAEDKPAEKKFSFSASWSSRAASWYKSAVSGERKKGRAVAAVRGDDQKTELADPDSPTVKGGRAEKKLKKQNAEDEELAKAKDLAEKDPAAGLAAFRDFKKSHPKSQTEMVDDAIAQLDKALAGDGDSSAPVPAAQPQTASDEKPKN
jgi:hypothetical protein